MVKKVGFLTVITVVLLAALLLPALVQPGITRAAGEDGTRDVITPTVISDAGTTMTLAAASGDGHKFPNTGREFVVVTNDYTATVTLTIITGGQAGGIAIDDVDVSLSAGASKIVGPFNPAIFNQNSGSDAGRIYLDWSAAVTGTVANSVTLNVYRFAIP